MTEPIPEAEEAEPLSGERAAPAPSEDLWQRIKEHKVLQWSLTYFGASLALAHAQDLLSHTYHWPEFVGRLLIGVLIVGFPIVLAVAWYHGHRGLKQISAGEMTVVSILVVIGAGLLIVLVRAPVEPATHSPTPESLPLSAAPSASGANSPTTTSASLPQAAMVAKKLRLAILPFENLSPDPANAFFADGLQEDVISTLATRAPGLEVISRTTMMLYRAAPKPVLAVAKELGATHVMEGSVRRQGDHVRLTLQLIDGTTDSHIWAHTYDRTLKDALSLQSDVAQEVASQLAVELPGGPRAATRPTSDPEAYDLYLKGLLARSASAVNPTLTGYRNDEDQFTAAIARDPSFAEAYAERVAPRILSFLNGFDAGDDPLSLAREDIAAGERLAPDNPKVLATRALYLHWVDHDNERSLAAFSAAESAGLADPLFLSVKADALLELGRCTEAIELHQRVLTLDQRNLLLIRELVDNLKWCRQPAEALRTLDFGIEQFPDALALREWRADLVFAYTGSTDALNLLPSLGIDAEFHRLRWTHRYSELQQLLVRTGAAVPPGPGSTAGELPTARYRGWVHLLLGDRTAAAQDGRNILDFIAHQKETSWNHYFLRRLAAEGHLFSAERTQAVAAAREALAIRSLDIDPSFGTVTIAAVYAWSGAGDEAMDLLEHLATATPGPGPAEITRDPLFTIPLAHNARYQQLSERLEAQMRATKLQ
jgi:TolB-like protein/tetratricopeptide (TPR) repeat protein